MRSIKLFLFGVMVVLSLITHRVSRATSAAAKPEDHFTLVKVADGVYAAIAKPGGLASGNAGFVVGDNSVLLFDTFFTPTAVQDLLVVIDSETRRPVKYAVNSHYHLDHTGGNQLLARLGVPIIGHDKLDGMANHEEPSLSACVGRTTEAYRRRQETVE